ncbi:thyroid hormone-inducible hepatic protein-like [Sceloporus undulatus]|uniref:thyroid hormone-inducible hepatic protein-like n=1 Tax=Sceloporus undulatus TaxID=8520 RepID=UPI001C4DAB18|nr:thyroid hormone-inducible hepatic protein-like [Sceloporus undulatus]
MEGYFSAVRKMEQTVMFPSLLLGVSLEDQDGTFQANNNNNNNANSGDRDLYEYYMLLKSIKSTAEGGLAPLKEKKLSIGLEEGKEEADLEGLFHFHVSGLHHVLTQLTRRANTVTSKYNEIMGQISQNQIYLQW